MQKIIFVDGLEVPITLARRKGSRSIRLSIKSDGSVRVGVPYGIPELLARKFVSDKIDWIKSHTKPQIILKNGDHIGKNHILKIESNNSNTNRTRVTNTEIIVRVGLGKSESSAEIQNLIISACERALKKESTILLTQRLKQISSSHNIDYRSCQVKKLRSRWGACDNHNNITLNIYLMQLDWQLIDYVICHELAHTQYHHHQASFWQYLETIYPDCQKAKKELKTKKTDIIKSAY